MLPGLERSRKENLQSGRNVIIKPAEKGSAVVVWLRNGYWKKAEKQLSERSTCLKIKILKKNLLEQFTQFTGTK